jgi:hypothetical protein
MISKNIVAQNNTAMSSLVLFENKNIFTTLKNTLLNTALAL